VGGLGRGGKVGGQGWGGERRGGGGRKERGWGVGVKRYHNQEKGGQTTRRPSKQFLPEISKKRGKEDAPRETRVILRTRERKKDTKDETDKKSDRRSSKLSNATFTRKPKTHDVKDAGAQAQKRRRGSSYLRKRPA